ncbi:hypothetical protein QFC24_006931 [Naganishia onofrii]|uniref:Uncharacterized protein n=1 Tax=Naganishia onofrii TaxID=1851511 RepID=A0ACC2WVF0_9TREE|nr:hypothetical protein QFC24_006931 [Naganishia onofrii]
MSRMSSNTFTQFTNSLTTTARHQARTFQQASTPKQLRTIAYLVFALLVVWFLGGWFWGMVVGKGGTVSGGGVGVGVVGDEGGLGL